MDKLTLRYGASEALISCSGSELQALRLGGLDLLWPAAPLWPRHAPLLFPIVGGLKGDAYQHQGRTYTLPRHGFARNRDFTWTSESAASCALMLEDDAESRAAYPFAFRLTVMYTLDDAGLHMALTLLNPGDVPLPASLGLHPAFRWPLAPGLRKASHRLVFEQDEQGPLRRVDAQGLLTPASHPTPIRGRVLSLSEGLFLEDALIFLEPRSSGLRFEAEHGPALTLRWTGFPHLGVWAKPDPGPSFLCVEPWQGYASPAAWDGGFTDKPGGFVLAPGACRHWTFDISLATV